MQSWFLTVMIFLSFLMIIIGIMCIKGKADFLFNDLLKNIKKKKSIIDKKGLSIFSGIGCLAIGIEIFAMAILGYYKILDIFRILAFSTCLTTIYMFAASQRYDITNFDENGKLKGKTKIAIVAVSLLILGFYFIVG